MSRIKSLFTCLTELKRICLLFVWIVCGWGLLGAVNDNSVTESEITIPLDKGSLHLTLLRDNAVRVQYVESSRLDLPEWLYEETSSEIVSYKSKKRGTRQIVTTKSMALCVDQETSRLTLEDRSGKVIFTALAHELLPAQTQGLDVYQASLTFLTDKDEYIYGLGQFQDGHSNLKGHSRRLTQVNTQIAMPFFLSSKGYALLWNNYGMTDFNPASDRVVMSRLEAVGEQISVDVTSTEGTRKEVRTNNLFQANIHIPETGDYALLLDVGQKMARRHTLNVDGQCVIDFRNHWLPPTTSIICHLEKGDHNFTAELEKNDKPTLYYRKVTDHNVMSSPVADCVDYTLFVGSADEVIASYRTLTGPSPMLPKWAFGYIHCRERYKSQQELLDNAKLFRQKGLPIDVIVQDWQYWGRYGWNAMRFDEQHYPSPDAMVKDLHAMNMRLMLSVWSKIDPASEVGKEMGKRGYYIPGTTWIDFFNPEAASYYWDNFRDKLLLPYKIDAWWQDATEPENDDLVGHKVNAGTTPGEVYRNVYPLLVSKTVYEGLRADDPDRRAMILTRSGYPGIQRYGSVLWTGDVGHDWETLRRQIIAGLGMMSSGHPWWTYDAGGFFRPYNQYRDPGYIECMLRWIQTATFLPLMRVHGYQSDTEPWRYGEQAEQIIAQYLRLRYRLLPYIYTGAAEVSLQGSTLMRPLVFDFPSDEEALRQTCEYMFGKSLLVHPVTSPGVSSYQTYLPKTPGGWYDFWSPRHWDGGANVETEIGLDKIPVFVRAGSILPLGPGRQYALEASAEPLELRVYPGADAVYTLYEDAGDGYGYEAGEYALIPIKWNDKRRTLTILPRQGSFSMMEEYRNFIVTLPDGTQRKVLYEGKNKCVIKF